MKGQKPKKEILIIPIINLYLPFFSEMYVAKTLTF